MRRQPAERADYDSPWKEFLTVFFREFILLVLPELYAMIDWTRPPQFLDNELRRLTPRSETGRLYTDRLVKVWLKNGEARAILIHIEAQSQFVVEIEARVFTYYARIWLELRLPIVSIVVYADKNPHWRPERYVQELPGTRLDFQFHAVKLLDWDEATLITQAQNRNPAAIMLLAFRKAMETEQDVGLRYEARKQLITLTMGYGYNADEQAHLLRLMEWVLMLPEVLEQQVEKLVEEYKRERGTTFVSRLERRAIQEGLEQGLERGLEQGLEQGLQQARTLMVNSIIRILRHRFGDQAEFLRHELSGILSLDALDHLHAAALDAPSLEDFRAEVQEALAQQAPTVENGQNHQANGRSSQ